MIICYHSKKDGTNKEMIEDISSINKTGVLDKNGDDPEDEFGDSNRPIKFGPNRIEPIQEEYVRADRHDENVETFRKR